MDTTLLDARIRRLVYDATLQTGLPPAIATLASAVPVPADLVRASLARLAGARVLVLQPTSGEILMAPPFSAVPTPFLVRTPSLTAYANCGWDALGVPVMARAPAEISSACGCCGDEITLHAQPNGVTVGTAVLHFAVPARRWWDDVVFT